MSTIFSELQHQAVTSDPIWVLKSKGKKISRGVVGESSLVASFGVLLAMCMANIITMMVFMVSFMTENFSYLLSV